jgi:hypothetical protein
MLYLRFLNNLMRREPEELHESSDKRKLTAQAYTWVRPGGDLMPHFRARSSHGGNL